MTSPALFALEIAGPTLLLASSVAAGLAGLSLGWLLISFSGWSLPRRGEHAGFELQRRHLLRDGSALYRSLEPLIDQLAQRNRQRDLAGKAAAASSTAPTRLEQIAQNLVTAAVKLPWLPEEYFACRQIESVVVALIGFGFGLLMFEDWIAASIGAVLALFGYQQYTLLFLASKAQQRRKIIEERLPFALDLMALMMEAGASFPEAVQELVNQSPGHPLGDEFSEVLRETSLGRTRRESLEGLKERLRCGPISELVFALIRGDELGTPLAQTLRMQATQLLTTRTQAVEKEAQEAAVYIVFPGMLSMLACLLIIVAPFILQAIYSG